MPLHKVPAPRGNSISEAERTSSRTAFNHVTSQLLSPEFASTASSASSSSSSSSSSGSLSAALSPDEDSGYADGAGGGGGGGGGSRGWARGSVDGLQRAFHGQQNGSSHAQSTTPLQHRLKSTESTGSRNNSSFPVQRLSIVELEIQQQSEREAELTAMRQSLFCQTSPENSIPESPAHTKDTALPHPLSRIEPRCMTSAADETKPRPSSLRPAAVVSASSSALKMTFEEVISTPSHSGESLIAREIMEMKQREEELRRTREGGGGGEATLVGPRDCSSVDGVHLAPLEEEEGTVRPPSASSHRSRRAPPKIRPFEEPEETAKFFPEENETPIEREMRLLREREDALRRARGLPPSPPPPSMAGDVVQVELVAGGGAVRSGERKSDQTMKKLASSLLLVEIEKEKQREMELKLHSQQRTTSHTNEFHDNSSSSSSSSAAKSTSSYNRRY